MEIEVLRREAWRNMMRLLPSANSSTIWENVLQMNEEQLRFAARASEGELIERARMEPSFGSKNLFWYHGK